MISRSRQKWLRGLGLKKHRTAEGVFVAEGPKVVGDLLEAGFDCVWGGSVGTAVDSRFEPLTEEELERVSFLEAPQQVIAVFRQPEPVACDDVGNRLCLALDHVQNPGNVGTIVRLADWFGIEDVLCSEGCADVFAPKTVQATMGALARVRVHVVDLPAFLARQREKGCPVYGTFLDGENIYGCRLEQRGVIVMGNEGKGVSAEVADTVSERLLVPHYPADRQATDSLNVAVATAIVCAEFRRQAR